MDAAQYPNRPPVPTSSGLGPSRPTPPTNPETQSPSTSPQPPTTPPSPTPPVPPAWQQPPISTSTTSVSSSRQTPTTSSSILNPPHTTLTSTPLSSISSIPPSTPTQSAPTQLPPSSSLISTQIPTQIPTQSNLATTPPDEPHISVASTGLASSRKFPLMIVSFVLIIVVSGFLGSFLFYQLTSQETIEKAQAPAITPPVTVAPTKAILANPFVSPTVAYQNPFITPTPAYRNPFGTYRNPFASLVAASDGSEPYLNPFEELMKQ